MGQIKHGHALVKTAQLPLQPGLHHVGVEVFDEEQEQGAQEQARRGVTDAQPDGQVVNDARPDAQHHGPSGHHHPEQAVPQVQVVAPEQDQDEHGKAQAQQGGGGLEGGHGGWGF